MSACAPFAAATARNLPHLAHTRDLHVPVIVNGHDRRGHRRRRALAARARATAAIAAAAAARVRRARLHLPHLAPAVAVARQHHHLGSSGRATAPRARTPRPRRPFARYGPRGSRRRRSLPSSSCSRPPPHLLHEQDLLHIALALATPATATARSGPGCGRQRAALHGLAAEPYGDGRCRGLVAL